MYFNHPPIGSCQDRRSRRVRQYFLTSAKRGGVGTQGDRLGGGYPAISMVSAGSNWGMV